MPFRYPIALELEGRGCVVVGGGPVAQQKAEALIQAGARVTVISETFTKALERLGTSNHATLVQRSYSYGDLDGAFLAVAATDDPSVNAEIFREAEEKRVLLNAVDDVAHCHFAVPSIVRRGDFLMTISTGGKAPALSKRLRQELSEQFGEEFETLVDLLGEVREETIGSREVSFETWAERWQVALDHDLIELVREGRTEEAKEIVRDHLTGRPDTPTPPSPRRFLHSAPLSGANSKNLGIAGRVAIVGAGPGDPGLITVRGKALVEGADVVVYDRLVHPDLVSGKRAVYVGKKPGRASASQEEINRLLVRLARSGHQVVRLKGGDPFVFGRGAEEAEALARAGVEFEIVPAPSSAIAAPAYAGIPITDRRHSSSVAITTGHRAEGREVDWKALASAVDTIVILMGMANLGDIAARLIDGGLDPATPSAAVENGTLPDQRVIVSPLSDLARAVADAGIASPATVVVGDVVELSDRIWWFNTMEDGLQKGGAA